MPVLNPIPGEWYFTVLCRACQSTVRFFPDENKGTRKITAKKEVQVVCLNCGELDTYNTSEMISTQEPKHTFEAGM
jgi:RNase P subunit RPR2